MLCDGGRQILSCCLPPKIVYNTNAGRVGVLVSILASRLNKGIAVSLLIGSAVLLSSSDKPAFTRRDKAFYASPDLVAFVRPGLVVKITGASIASDGTVQAKFTLADPNGLPLDRTGVETPGAVSTSFIVAVLPHGQNQYTAYTTKAATSSATGVSTEQPSADSGGTYQQTGNGQYTYTFKTKAANFDATATHTIGVYSSRDLTEYDLSTYYADNVFTFVPNGSPVTVVHDEIRTISCNKCHDPLSAHGGARMSVPLCVLCHQPQNLDPNTGNSLDMKVFIHKIHMGSSLPSVVAGTPYEIVGYENSINNFSTVVFPADVRTCTYCHEGGLAQPPNSGQPGQGGITAATAPTGADCGSSGNPGCNPDFAPFPATHVNYWLSHPSRAACGSCHDNVNFATGQNHENLPEPDDSQCANCHTIQGELPFDASILGAHTIPQFAPGLPGVVFQLVKVDNGAAGKTPTVTFTVNDKSGKPLLPSQMASLSLVMAGPTADYQTSVSEDVRTKATGQNGTYTYTFTATVPANAAGTYSIGIEGYNNVTLLPGTAQQQVVRDVGFNQVINFSVDGSTVAPHPVEITQVQCNSCHFALSLHGTIRQNVQYCLFCHNPTATDSSQRPAAQNPPQTIDFPVMVHRIHIGAQAAAGGQLTPFLIYGFGGSQNDFSGVLFPGNIQDCMKCHTNGSEEPPVPAGRIAVTNPRAYINPSPPTTAACTGCHVAQDASAHAAANTSPALGESCNVCHGSGAEYDVDKVHAE